MKQKLLVRCKWKLLTFVSYKSFCVLSNRTKPAPNTDQLLLFVFRVDPIYMYVPQFGWEPLVIPVNSNWPQSAKSGRWDILKNTTIVQYTCRWKRIWLSTLCGNLILLSSKTAYEICGKCNLFVLGDEAGWNDEFLTFELKTKIDILSTFSEITIMWIPQHLIGD